MQFKKGGELSFGGKFLTPTGAILVSIRPTFVVCTSQDFTRDIW